VNIELANWRSVVAPPGLSKEQTAALLDVVDKMVKSPQWKAILEKNDWVDLYMPGDQFATYLKAEDARITDILKTIGLVK
jgi:putative tricarboxylic transport membrane protein